MSCDPVPRRSLAGRIELAIAAVGLVFYLWVGVLVITPEVGEGYRRTYVTGEFSVVPDAESFGATDGLAYRPGRPVSMRLDDGRRYLARFDWNRWASPVPTLSAARGRLFLHLPAGTDPDAPRRLRLGLVCRSPRGRTTTLDVTVAGRTIGSVACGRGTVEADLAIPPGLLGERRWDEIALQRRSRGVVDRLATRLAVRRDTVGLDWFAIEPDDAVPMALDGIAPARTE